jgi:protease I
MPNIQDARILIMATHGVEQAELTTPRDELRKRGAKVEVASPEGEPIRGWNMKDWGDMIESDLRIADIKPSEYDALVLPGGQINPDLLRINPDAIEVVRTFVERGKPVAAVCHGPWLLIEADAVEGREMTSYKSIRKDVENAGGRWLDREVVVDSGIVTSRSPADLPAFIGKIIEEIEEGVHPRRTTA